MKRTRQFACAAVLRLSQYMHSRRFLRGILPSDCLCQRTFITPTLQSGPAFTTWGWLGEQPEYWNAMMSDKFPQDSDILKLQIHSNRSPLTHCVPYTTLACPPASKVCP